MTAEVRVDGESRITTVTPIIVHSRRLADCVGLAETERSGPDPAKRGVVGGWTQEKAQQLMLRGDGAGSLPRRRRGCIVPLERSGAHERWRVMPLLMDSSAWAAYVRDLSLVKSGTSRQSVSER
jgi:hypothetical protein